MLCVVHCTNETKINIAEGSNECAYKKNINGDTVVVCNYDKISQEVVDVFLSSFIDSCEITKLETSDSSNVKVASTFGTFVSENYIGVRNNKLPFMIFDHSGKFIRKIGNIGHGPSEYINIYDEIIDEENDCIYLLPWQSNEILRYDLQGNPISPIKLKYSTTKATMFIRHDTVTILNLPFSSESIIAFVQKFDGQIVYELLAGGYSLKPDFSNEIISLKNDENMDMHLFNFGCITTDTLYHYKEDHLQPVFAVNFNSKEIPPHNYYELPGYYICQTMTWVKAQRRTYNAINHEILLVDKTTLETKRIRLLNDYLGNIEMDFLFKNGKFINNLSAIDLKERISKVLDSEKDMTPKDREQLINFNNSLNDEDNNIVFSGDIK